MAILEFDEVHTKFEGRPALQGADLRVEDGETHALIGERRAGKSGVARLLSGAGALEGGRIRFQGQPITRFTPRALLRAGIRIFPQSSKLIPSLTAWENALAGRMNIGFGARTHRLQAEEQILTLAARWGLKPDLRCPVSRLNRAEQGIVELARTLCFSPTLVLFDEPAGRFTADEMQVLYLILAELRRQGTPILYAASGVDEILRLADRVSVMKAGRIIDTQRVQDLDRESLVDLAYSFRESREELMSKNIRLLRYKKYNEEIVSNLPLGTIVLNRAGEVYLANTVALRLVGGQAESLTNSALEEALGADLYGAILTGATAGHRAEWVQVPTREGRFVDLLAFPFHDSDHGHLGTILTLEDVTERKVTRDYLVQAEKVASIAELSAGIVHEVDNPLGIISNYIELLLIRGQDSYTAERLEIIQDEIKRIHGIMVSLLSFAHVGDETLVITDLGPVAHHCLTLLEHEAERRSVGLEAELPGVPVLARVDPARIKQILINLILNALDAVPAGGTIRLSLQAEENTARFEVSDTGPGIPAAMVATLFTPFVNGKSDRNHAGLGLSVSKHIVDAHGGRIWCESRPGQTRFFVELPTGN